MDVIPLDANLVKGSHGRTGVSPEYQPVIISAHKLDNEKVYANEVFDIILGSLRNYAK
jgi:hypothetical protein